MSLTGAFDRLPAGLRHVILMLLAASGTWGLAWVQAHDTSWHLPAYVLMVVSALCVYLGNWLLPFSQQYGVKSGVSQAPDISSLIADVTGLPVLPDGFANSGITDLITSSSISATAGV